MARTVRVGAVNYLNTRPLICARQKNNIATVQGAHLPCTFIAVTLLYITLVAFQLKKLRQLSLLLNGFGAHGECEAIFSIGALPFLRRKKFS